jgi:hypothetical protein
MRHTKKNRKQTKNGRNKKRFSKKRIGGIGVGSITSALSGIKKSFVDKTKVISELNSPVNKLNRQLISGQEVTSNEINTVNLDEYNKINWKWENKNKGNIIEVRPFVTLDGVEALLNQAKNYFKSHPNESLKLGEDIRILTNRISELKKLGEKNDTPKEDTLSAELINLEDGVSDDKLKEMFIKILTTGGLNHLKLFETNGKNIINFDDFTNNNGDTAFMMIASNPNPELLSYVLDPKNEIKDKINFGTNEKNGQNILHIAANNKNPKIMQILFDENAGITDKIIEYGFINPKTNNEYKNLPIDILCNNSENIGEEYIKNIKLLIDNRSNFYTAYDIIKTKINNFTQLIKPRLTDAKKAELNNKLQTYNKIMEIFDTKKKEIITECSKSLESKYTNEAAKQAIIGINKDRWIKLDENKGREQITEEKEKTTFDVLFDTKLNELKNNDKDVFKNYPCDLVINDKPQDDNINIAEPKNEANEANKTPPPLVQGGRHRVTKRLQHNLRRYKL